ncbi:hypothetical protein DFR76_102456 [Nocardia pseudobrasiliensis]|uniref:Glycine rich protein n=2 Tax=Nocardia pseudobrasiliensis TaxID=45979 RepID=A0A370IBE1_9NOCA|nr:hypothetical protein DFR76_102456 [Nocardia pseudobrasiliensis]
MHGMSLRLGAIAGTAAMAWPIVAAVPAAAAPLPPECRTSGTTVTCVYTNPDSLSTGRVLELPMPVTRIHIEAVGARGAASCCHTVAAGGRGARAGGDASVPPGSRLNIHVAVPDPAKSTGGGGRGGSTRPVPGADATAYPNVRGGDGGGASSVSLDLGVIIGDAPGRLELVTAAGGGGGAATWDGRMSPGGDAGMPGGGERGGAAGTSDTALAPGGGENVFGTDLPAGGRGGPGYGGTAGGDVGVQGSGTGGGGGGGAGWHGGGGGAIGGTARDGRGDPDTPPGGGGGGASLVPLGGTIGPAGWDEQPSVVISFDLPAA